MSILCVKQNHLLFSIKTYNTLKKHNVQQTTYVICNNLYMNKCRHKITSMRKKIYEFYLLRVSVFLQKIHHLKDKSV